MRPRTLGVTMLAVALLGPAVARAQGPDDVARADALFNAAKQLRDAGQYADACPQFAQSSRLAPGIGVSLYLADCYEHVGRTASAWTEFNKAEKLARERNDKRAELARSRAQALEPKLSGLTITVPPAIAQEGGEVLLDGARVAPEEWNAAVAVDPGDHVVTVNVPGQTARTLRAHVIAGSRSAVIHIDDFGGPPPEPKAPPVTAPPPPPPESVVATDPGATRRWVGVVFLGLGAAGVGIGSAILLNKNQNASNASSCNPQPTDNTSNVESTVAFAVGGLALATGLVLTVSASHPKGLGVVVAPMMTAGGGGALVQSTF
ncbi:MAG: tetratricopeptide repeat protein [Polyangiaceae bacterium]